MNETKFFVVEDHSLTNLGIRQYFNERSHFVCCGFASEKDEALNKLKDNGLIIPPILKVAFEKLYAYTNQPDTGIRHALMDEDGIYTPASEEALFMLVSCSSFINYLNKKMK